MSFATNVRRSLARESDALADELGIEPVAPEAVEEVLTDSISTDIQTDVVADAADSEVGGADLDAAAATADEMEALGNTLEASVADGGEGVDATAGEMAVAALERCARQYNTARRTQFSRESAATKQGRREVTLALAKEAADNGKTLWARVVETAENLWKWLKTFVAGLLDKRKRLATKAEALITKAGELKKANATVAEGAKISYGGSNAVVKGSVGTDVAAPLKGAEELIGNLDWVPALATDSASQVAQTSDKAETNLNPAGVGNLKFTIKVEDDRPVVTKESAGVSADARDIAPLSLDAAIAVAKEAKGVISKLQAGEAEIKKAEQSVGGLLGKLKALATGKETTINNAGQRDTGAAKRGAILARLRAVSTITSTVAGVSLSVTDYALSIVAKSLAAHKAPAAAAAK